MTMLFKNNASSRNAVAISAAAGSITLTSGTGAKFPSPVAPDFFMVTIDDRRTGQVEICKCTARVNDVLTVTRAQEGTAAQAFAIGAIVANRFTAATLDELFNRDSYTKAEADSRYVNVTGDVMTGPLTLAAAPAVDLQAATKKYVDDRTPITVDAPNNVNAYGRSGGVWVTVVSTATYTASDVLAKLLTVDGPGSGLNADLLDGHDTAFFATATDMASVFVGLTDLDARTDVLEAALPTKAGLASPVFTGNPTAPTPAVGDNDTSIATTAFVKNQGYAPLAGPVFTGDPKAPTAAPGDNDDSIATTAFVTAAVVAAGSVAPSNSSPVMDGVAAPGTSPLYSRGDHVHPTDTTRAPLASPVFTGNPTAPTPLAGDNDTSIATTAFVTAADVALKSSIVGSATAAMDTLGEVETALALKAPLASPVFTGAPAAPTPAAGDNDTSIATTAFVSATSNIVSTLYTSGDTWTKPAGCKFVEVWVQGGGGGGGGATSSAGEAALGAGGGGGGLAWQLINASTLGATVAVTVGAAGTAGAAANGTGGTGGSSSFGTVSAAGGAGGTSTASGSTAALAAGGIGGLTTAGSVFPINGTQGEGATRLSGSAGRPGVGGDAGGGCGGARHVTAPGAGVAGASGSGGSGGFSSGGTGGFAGGAGGAGYVYIREYY